MIPDAAAHRETMTNVGSNDLYEPVPSLVQLFYIGCYVVFWIECVTSELGTIY